MIAQVRTVATLDFTTASLIATRMLEFNRRKRYPLTLYRSLVTTADIVIIFIQSSFLFIIHINFQTLSLLHVVFIYYSIGIFLGRDANLPYIGDLVFLCELCVKHPIFMAAFFYMVEPLLAISEKIASLQHNIPISFSGINLDE